MTDQRLTNSDLAELTDWRRALHRRPEVSGAEHETARSVHTALQMTGPDRIVTGLGGHGVAALFDSGVPGPRVMLRCELDGLPITELSNRPYRSEIEGKGHLCGHDGHMAILTGMARLLGRRRPSKGAVVLMFQPAEETGEGAARVVVEPEFAGLTPDYAFAIHNYPGMPFAHVGVVDGPASCASRGMRVRLTGRTAHASLPETGLSPAPTLARLMQDMPGLSQGADLTDPDFALVTVCHARLGEPAFGIAPGEAELYATLRSLTDPRMERLITEAEALSRATARELGISIDYHDIFPACANTALAAQIVRRAGARAGLTTGPGLLPMRPSEDFGQFGSATGAESAFILLGAGHSVADLHNPDYDFPDDLIGPGTALFSAILSEILGD